MGLIESFFQKNDINYGWVMVVVVFTLSGLAFGSMASISVFLKPVSLEFDWSRGQTSFAYTVASFSSAAFGVFWGYVADKYGTKWFGLAGALSMGFIFFSLSSLDSIYKFYLLYFLFGAFGSALLFSPLYANVGFWFRENPGLALGIAASGGAVGQAFVPHISGILIEASGWRDAYIYLALIYLAISLPIALLIQESPWREGALPGYILMSLGQTIFVVWFPHLVSPLGIYLIAALFGFTYSGVMSSILVCTRMMVSAKFGARAMSITSFFGWIGMGLGGFLGGYLFDIYGDYTLAFTIAGISGIINLIILTIFFLQIRRNSNPAIEFQS